MRFKVTDSSKKEISLTTLVNTKRLSAVIAAKVLVVSPSCTAKCRNALVPATLSTTIGSSPSGYLIPGEMTLTPFG